MHVPAGDRLDELVRDNSQSRVYTAFLRTYNPVTGVAQVATARTSTQVVAVSVSATLRLFPVVLQPDVRVHLRKVGNHPPLLTDVLSAGE